MVDGVSSSGVVQAAQPQQTTGIDVDAIRAGSSFGGKVVNVLRGLVHLGPTQASVQKHNDDVSAQFFQAASKRYGTTLATQVSASLLRQGQDATPVSKQELRSADATLHEVFDAIRNSDELKAYIPGGAEFTKLAQRYPLSSPAAQQTFERNLVSLAVEQGAKVENVEALANLAASTATGHVVRAYDGEHSLNGAHKNILETKDIQKLQSQTPWDDKEAQAGLKTQLDAKKSELVNKDFAISTGFGSPTFTTFERLTSDGKIANSAPELQRDGNKLHLSINADQLEQAYDVLTPLLLSEDNPFLGFKATNTEGARQTHDKEIARLEKRGDVASAEFEERRAGFDRITQGAQITLYPYAEDPSFADGADAFKNFVGKLEQALQDAGIAPGVIPESDAGIDGFSFATFRNESGSRGAASGDKAISQADIDALKDKPFYQALTR
jgi:hypothetical protein